MGKDVFMVSTEGGMEIEKVAEETPEKIVKEWINPLLGMKSFQARKLAFGLGLSGDAFKTACKVLQICTNATRNRCHYRRNKSTSTY